MSADSNTRYGQIFLDKIAIPHDMFSHKNRKRIAQEIEQESRFFDPEIPVDGAGPAPTSSNPRRLPQVLDQLGYLAAHETFVEPRSTVDGGYLPWGLLSGS